MRLKLLPYKIGSQSAKALARELGCLRIFPDEYSKYRHRQSNLIINWGLSTTPSHIPATAKVLNKFSAVQVACNKSKTFDAFLLRGISSPSFTYLKGTAINWIEEGYKVYCRQTLTGHSGQGIVVASSISELVNAPLYTREVKAGKEYRVHVFDGKVIDYAKKGRRISTDEADRPSHLIRNYSKGWVFLRDNQELPEIIKEESIRAVKALGLDFGAVDIAMIKDTTDQCCTYEVNTSPGLQGTTIKAYVDAIRRYSWTH